MSKLRGNEAGIDKAYLLDWNTQHIEHGTLQDAWPRRYTYEKKIPNGSEFFLIREELDLPDRVEFFAITESLELTDYPYNEVNWPIMSKQMLNVLRAVGQFRHITYPIIMIDPSSRRFDENDQPISDDVEIPNTHFLAVHVLEHQEVFDWENSVYQCYKDNPKIIKESSLDKIVLKEPDNGFPPLFYVEGLNLGLYVSAEARFALEVAGIKGIDFVSAEDGCTFVSRLP